MGEFENYGVYRYKTGEVYEGSFKDGESHALEMLRSKMGISTQETGKTARVMEMVLLQKRLVPFTQEIGLWDRSMAKEFNI